MHSEHQAYQTFLDFQKFREFIKFDVEQSQAASANGAHKAIYSKEMKELMKNKGATATFTKPSGAQKRKGKKNKDWNASGAKREVFQIPSAVKSEKQKKMPKATSQESVNDYKFGLFSHQSFSENPEPKMQKNKTDIAKALKDVRGKKETVHTMKLIIEKLGKEGREELLDFIVDLDPMLRSKIQKVTQENEELKEKLAMFEEGDPAPKQAEIFGEVFENLIADLENNGSCHVEELEDRSFTPDISFDDGP